MTPVFDSFTYCYIYLRVIKEEIKSYNLQKGFTMGAKYKQNNKTPKIKTIMTNNF